MTITNTQIESLLNEAATYADYDQVGVCNIALRNDGPYTIATAKGSFSGTLDEVCAWQAEMQAAVATIGGLDVDAIDFDGEDLDATRQRVVRAARAECERIIDAAAAMTDGE